VFKHGRPRPQRNKLLRYVVTDQATLARLAQLEEVEAEIDELRLRAQRLLLELARENTDEDLGRLLGVSRQYAGTLRKEALMQVDTAKPDFVAEVDADIAKRRLLSKQQQARKHLARGPSPAHPRAREKHGQTKAKRVRASPSTKTNRPEGAAWSDPLGDPWNAQQLAGRVITRQVSPEEARRGVALGKPLSKRELSGQ
jgi:hypothetical protein